MSSKWIVFIIILIFLFCSENEIGSNKDNFQIARWPRDLLYCNGQKMVTFCNCSELMMVFTSAKVLILCFCSVHLKPSLCNGRQSISIHFLKFWKYSIIIVHIFAFNTTCLTEISLHWPTEWCLLICNICAC